MNSIPSDLGSRPVVSNPERSVSHEVLDRSLSAPPTLVLLKKKAELGLTQVQLKGTQWQLDCAREDLARHPAPPGCDASEARAHKKAAARVKCLEGEVAELGQKIQCLERDISALEREIADCGRGPSVEPGGTPIPLPIPMPLPLPIPRPETPRADQDGSTYEPGKKPPVDLDPPKAPKPPKTTGEGPYSDTVKVVPWTEKNSGTADSSLSGVARNQLKSRLGADAWKALPEKKQNELVDNAWRHVYAHNRAAVGNNPDLVHPGLELKIPADLVKLSEHPPEALKVSRQIRG